VLSPYQQFFIGSLIGWYTTKGFRRFRAGVLETGKGSGKTPMGAGLMIYLTIADGERGAQVFVAAAVLSQAKIAFTDVERMVEASPSLRRVFDPDCQQSRVSTNRVVYSRDLF
jgi:phage terminase large subunit-like protein